MKVVKSAVSELETSSTMQLSRMATIRSSSRRSWKKLEGAAVSRVTRVIHVGQEHAAIGRHQRKLQTEHDEGHFVTGVRDQERAQQRPQQRNTGRLSAAIPARLGRTEVAQPMQERAVHRDHAERNARG